MSGGALVAIAAIALAARFLFLRVGGSQGLFEGLFLDSRYYADQAAAIRLGHGAGAHPYLLSPLYPYFLALFTDGQGILDASLVRAVQACAGSATVVLVAYLAARYSGRAAGWIAGLSAALYGPAIHYDAAILVPALLGLLLTGAVTLIVVDAGATSGRRSLALRFIAGVAFGMAAALHPMTLCVAPVALATTAIVARRSGAPWRDVGIRAAALVAGLVVSIAPFTVRNATRGGELVLLSANGGINFWIGNQSMATGLFRSPPGYDFREDPVGRAIAEQALKHRPTYGEASSWWRDRALADIASAPVRWVGLLAKKAAYFAHSGEISQLGENFAWFRARAWPLSMPLDARMILILVLAAPIAIALRSGRRGLLGIALPLAVVVAYGAVVVLFFPTGRYRAPIMPLATAIAAVGAVEGFRSASGSAVRFFALLGGVLALLGVTQFVYSGPLALHASTAIEERYQGMTMYAAGRYAEAIECYERALELDDDLATRTNLANALKAFGRVDAAILQYHSVLARNPRDGITWYNLGNLLRQNLHDLRGAQDAYRRATEFSPEMPEAHFNLGATLIDLGEYEAAIASIEAALSLASPTATWRSEAEDALLIARTRQVERRPQPR